MSKLYEIDAKIEEIMDNADPETGEIEPDRAMAEVVADYLKDKIATEPDGIAASFTQMDTGTWSSSAASNELYQKYKTNAAENPVFRNEVTDADTVCHLTGTGIANIMLQIKLDLLARDGIVADLLEQFLQHLPVAGVDNHRANLADNARNLLLRKCQHTLGFFATGERNLAEVQVLDRQHGFNLFVQVSSAKVVRVSWQLFIAGHRFEMFEIFGNHWLFLLNMFP